MYSFEESLEALAMVEDGTNIGARGGPVGSDMMASISTFCRALKSSSSDIFPEGYPETIGKI